MAVNQLTTFIPQVWATRLNVSLRKNLVLANIVNQNYQGQVRPGGTVKIQRPGSIAVADYDPTTTTVTYATPNASTLSLIINVRKYWAFQIDDLDADLSNVNLINAYTEEASYSLRDEVDQSIAAEYANAGLTDITLDVSSGTPDYYGALVTAGKQLDEANVPSEGRWHVTSAAGYAALLEDSKFTSATAAGDQVVRSGAVGMAAGFNIYKSNNLEVVAGTPDYRKTLYGTVAAISHARALTGQPEAFRLEGKMATGIRGELAWGNKTIEPNALGTLSLQETA